METTGKLTVTEPKPRNSAQLFGAGKAKKGEKKDNPLPPQGFKEIDNKINVNGNSKSTTVIASDTGALDCPFNASVYYHGFVNR